jgi:hypothetical protein
LLSQKKSLHLLAMKMKTLLLTATLGLLIVAACKKEVPEPVRPSVQEVNAPYQIQYGWVTFWHKPTSATYYQIYLNGARRATMIWDNSAPACNSDGRATFQLGEGSYTYSVDAKYSGSKPDSILPGQTVNVVAGQCTAIEITIP